MMSDINDKIAFLERYDARFDTPTPLRTVLINKPPKLYITDNMIFLITFKDKAYKNSNENRSATNVRYYKDVRNYLTTAIKKEKKSYFEHQIRLNRRTPTKLWSDYSIWSVHRKVRYEISSELMNPNSTNKFFANVE